MIELIVPPVPSGGVYDFSCSLKQAMDTDEVRLTHVSANADAGVGMDQRRRVILQMSGYGFDKRGAPLWLLREFERRRKGIKTLGVFFHELYAFGPPWRSSFWLSPVQRHIARRLAELSDFWMTNREGSAQWLRKFAGDKPHAVLPVFSNVGETASPTAERTTRIVIFGSSALREKTYKAAGDKLFAWARKASLEVHDIGAPVKDPALASVLHTRGVIQHGALDRDAVDRLLSAALFGVVAYPTEYVAKSGVFAAYAAHGLCPILLSAEHGDADGLKAGVHYLPHLPDPGTAADIDSIRKAAWEWYQPHSIARHAETLIGFLDLSSREAKC